MLLSLRENGPTSLFKEVRVFRELLCWQGVLRSGQICGPSSMQDTWGTLLRPQVQILSEPSLLLSHVLSFIDQVTSLHGIPFAGNPESWRLWALGGKRLPFEFHRAIRMNSSSHSNFASASSWLVTGNSLHSPEKGNVDEMPENVDKNVQRH